MDEITLLFRRIIAEPVERCKGHKPVVEVVGGVWRWRCILCGQTWAISGRKEDAQ
jgi:hypothetical protein